MKELRPYQLRFHETSIAKYNEGITRQLGVLFTGAGKTFLTIELLKKYDFNRVLWLSFQEELISQSGLAFIKERFDERFYNHVKQIGFLEYVKDNGLFAMSDFKIGCIKADLFKPDANVVMGSVQTVVRRLDKLPPDYFDCIVCDEAHCFGSQTAYKTISHFTPKLLLGLTATPHRQDGMMLGDIFDEIVFEYGLDKGIRDGHACELDAIRVKTNVSLDKVRTTAGELNQKDLSNEINTLARNQLIVQKYKEHAEGRQTIAFCVDIQHAIDLAEAFKLNGYSAEAVSSNEELTPDRSEKIEGLKEGRIQIITNVNILVAGYDYPDTGCVIMACPTKSLTKYLQAVGRAARLKTEGFVKRFGQNAIILDIVDSTNRHNLVNAWELDREKPPEERTFISSVKRDKLILDRLKKVVKLEHERLEDEKVKLISLPKIKVNKSIRMREPATEAQLNAIKNWGYDIENVHYTKQMINEIFMQQSASEKQIGFLKWKGFDVSKGVSKAQAAAAFKLLEEKGLK